MRVGLLAALALYGIILAAYLGAYAGGSDSSGYLNNARLAREGRMHLPQRTIEGLPPSSLPTFAYVPLGFLPVQENEMVPTYPIGLSLLVVGVSQVTGWDAAPAVTVWLHGMLGVVLMYALGRAFGFAPPASALGAVLLGASPLYLFCSLQAMSDTPALVWTALAIYFAWRSRERDAWAVAAGFAVAIAVLVRPANLLVLVPLALCLGGSWRRWLGLALGGLPGAVFLAAFNARLYGKIFTTGYGNVAGAFGWENVPLVLRNGAQWMPVLLTPALLLVLALPWCASQSTRRLVWVLTSWIAVFVGFYLFYFHTSEHWWYLRFFLPAFPPLILGMLWVGRAVLAARLERHARAALVLAVVFVVAWDGWWIERQGTLKIGRDERVYLQVSRWAQTHLPANAVIACLQASGAFLYYTDFTVLRYDTLKDRATLGRIERACAAAGRPIYATLFPFEMRDALERAMPGRWTQVGVTRQATFWRRDGAEPTPIEPITWREFVTARLGHTEVIAQVSSEWHDIKKSLFHRWIWNAQRGQIDLETWPLETGTIDLNFLLRGFAPTEVAITQDGTTLWHGPVDRELKPVTLRVPIHEGMGRLQFVSAAPGVPETPEPGARRLAFAIYDLKLSRPPP
ncbi:MAG: hypothetical protein JWM32_1398 [Verrucomicrobia bacterium]|nr:hypothetical protein [Verrucomicrobiota bacterium]